MSTVAAPIAFLISSVLVYTGVVKVLSPNNTGLAIRLFLDGLLPQSERFGGAWAGVALGMVEVAVGAVLGIAVVAGFDDPRIVAAWTAVVLFSVFAMVMLRSVLLGRSFSCSCFGAGSGDISYPKVLRAVVFATLAGVAAVADIAAPGVRTIVYELLLVGSIWTIAGLVFAIYEALTLSRRNQATEDVAKPKATNPKEVPTI